MDQPNWIVEACELIDRLNAEKLKREKPKTK